MRRTLIVSGVLAVVLVAVQLIAGNGWVVALVTGVAGFVVAALVLFVADRFSNRAD